MRSSFDKPLAGFRSPLGIGAAVAAVDAYAVNGSSPKTVADFAGVLNGGVEYYRKAGVETTFSDMFTYSDTGSLGVMTDSDGALKWKLHNLRLYSSDFSDGTWLSGGALVLSKSAGQTDPDGGSTAATWTPASGSGAAYFSAGNITTVVGAQYTAEIVVSPGDYRYFSLFEFASGSGSGSVMFDTTTVAVVAANNGASTSDGSITDLGGGWYRCRYTFSATNTTINPRLYVDDGGTYPLSVTGNASDAFTVAWPCVYRSDLGGMVDNPDRSDSYVPTTSGARFLARRNHYRWTGAAYSKKGTLLESAATNLTPSSSYDFTSGWVKTARLAAIPSPAETGRDGESSLTLLSTVAATGNAIIYDSITSLTANANYCWSWTVKQGSSGHRYVVLGWQGQTAENFASAVFDIGADNTEATETDVGTSSGTVVATHQEEVADGIWRLTIVASVNQTICTPWIGFAEAATGNTFTITGSVTATWAGTEDLCVGENQCELGSVPTSYIPSDINATVTRAAETLEIAGSDMAASTSTMSFHLEGEISYGDQNAIGQIEIYDWSADANNQIALFVDTQSTNAGDVRLRQEVGGAGWNMNADEYLSPGLNGAFNYASRHTDDVFNYATDGTAATEDTSPTGLPDLSSGPFEFGSKAFTGTFALFRQNDSDWGDTGIAGVTA